MAVKFRENAALFFLDDKSKIPVGKCVCDCVCVCVCVCVMCVCVCVYVCEGQGIHP